MIKICINPEGFLSSWSELLQIPKDVYHHKLATNPSYHHQQSMLVEQCGVLYCLWAAGCMDQALQFIIHSSITTIQKVSKNMFSIKKTYVSRMVTIWGHSHRILINICEHGDLSARNPMC